MRTPDANRLGGVQGMGRLGPLLGVRAPALLGVDIGSSAVKVLELGRGARGYSVNACAIEPLPAGMVSDDGQIADVEPVGEAVRRAVARAGTRARHGAVAVPGTLVIDKHISLAAGLRDQDMEDQIRAEADQHIAFPLDEVQLDFVPVGTTADDDTSVDVLLVACRKEHVEARVAAIELAGLQARVVDIETYALEGACHLLLDQLPDGGQGRTVALVDVGATTSSMLVLDNLRHVYAHDQNFGGNQLTEEIARHFEMKPDEAEKAKLAGELPPAYMEELLPHFYDDLAQQIQRAMQYFSAGSRTARHTVDDLLLAGGSARLPGIAEAISDRLQLKAKVAEPFAKVKVSGRARAKQVRDEGPALLLAAGLAMRAFDERR